MSKIRFLFKLHPDFFTDRIEEEAAYADFEDYEKWTFSTIFLSVLTLGIICYLLPYGTKISITAFILLFPLVYFGSPYIVFSVAAERRKTEMERVLPDALLLIGTNIKSGTSINRAFLASAREEFGPLEKELRTTAIQISGGKSVKTSLDNLRDRVKSQLFSDTLKVLTDAIESGGNTAELLESSAHDIRKSLELRDEIKSSIRMYVMFILLAAIFGAPILFAITTYMAEMTTQMWQETDISQAKNFMQQGSSGISFQQPDVNTDFLFQFSIAALTISNFFASLIISEIRNGNLKEGAKYIPFTVTTAVSIYIAVNWAVSSAFGS